MLFKCTQGFNYKIRPNIHFIFFSNYSEYFVFIFIIKISRTIAWYEGNSEVTFYELDWLWHLRNDFSESQLHPQHANNDKHCVRELSKKMSVAPVL